MIAKAINAMKIPARRGRPPRVRPAEGTPAPVIQNTLNNLEKAMETSPLQGEDKHIAVSAKTMISAITNAAISSRYALQLELATGLTLFAEQDGVSRDSKQALQEIYVQAGYDAKDQYKADYKTVRRRIDASAELYNWIGQDQVAKLIENRAEMAAINALVQHLEQYNLKGINSVFALIGKPIAQTRKAPAEHTAPEKQPEQKTEAAQDNNAIAAAIAAQVEQDREARRKAGALKTFTSEHVEVIVAKGTSREELMQMAMDLLAFANTIPEAKKATT